MRWWLPILFISALLAVPGRIASADQPGEEPCYLGAKGHNFSVIPVQGDPPGLLTFQWPGERRWPALFTWLSGGEWHSLPVALDGLTGYPSHSAVIWQDGSPVLLIGMEGQGSGGFGQFAQARPDGAGRLQATPLTDVTGHVNFDFIEPGLILMTYRGSTYSPTAWNCNACWPVNDQKLLRWENGQVQVLGQRVLPGPCFTATRFLGLLQAGANEEAAQLAATGSAVEQARHLLEIDPNAPFAWSTEDCWHLGGAGNAIEKLERRNWDLIPAPYRTSLPKEMQHFDLTLKRGSERAILQMIRRPEGWLVTAVQRPR